MPRLLWKEFHELKWYLAALLLLPWAITLWAVLQMKASAKDAYDLCFWVCTLPLAVWASTRFGKDMAHPNHLSVQWLPVNRWIGFASKFVPGLLVAALGPAWMRFVVIVCSGDSVPWSPIMPAAASSIYAVTFAVSIFLPSLPAALVGVVLDMIACGWTLKHLPSYIPQQVGVGALAGIATAASLGVWARPASFGFGPRASGAARGIAVGLVPVLCLTILVSARYAGGLDEFRTLRTQHAAQRKSAEEAMESHFYLMPPPLVSPDGRSFAYVVIHEASPYDRTTTMIADIANGRIAVPGETAAPAAWLRDGDLLVFTGTTGSGVQLRRFCRRENRLILLASFPPCAGDRYWMRPILAVSPDPSSDRVALLVMPPSGGLPDLWVVDSQEGHPKLIRRSLDVKSPTDSIAWHDGQIVIARQSNYWRIPPDGSWPLRVTSALKEVSRG